MAARRYLPLVLLVSVGAPGCAAGTREFDPPPDTRVILMRDDEPEAIWHFVPIDVLPGGLDAELVELVPPPPPPRRGG